LGKRGIQLKDLLEVPGFRDGVPLCYLLEELSGKKMPIKPVLNPQQRFQKLQNISVALKFITDQGIRLVSCGAEDICEGNSKLTLGLIWTLIQKFQIQSSVTSAFEKQALAEMANPSSASSSSKGQPHVTLRKGAGAKEMLLTWAKEQLCDYPEVEVKNLSSNWQDGTLFLHLIHSARPDLVDLNAINPNDAIGNLKLAFDLANENLGIPKLLDSDSLLDDPNIDEQSIMTYLSLFPTKFNELGVIPGFHAQNQGPKTAAPVVLDLPPPPPPIIDLAPPPPPLTDDELFSLPNGAATASHTHSNVPNLIDVDFEDTPIATEEAAPIVEDVEPPSPSLQPPDEASREGRNGNKEKKSKKKHTKEDVVAKSKAATMLVPLEKGSKMRVFSLKVIREIQG